MAGETQASSFLPPHANTHNFFSLTSGSKPFLINLLPTNSITGALVQESFAAEGSEFMDKRRRCDGVDESCFLGAYVVWCSVVWRVVVVV